MQLRILLQIIENNCVKVVGALVGKKSVASAKVIFLVIACLN